MIAGTGKLRHQILSCLADRKRTFPAHPERVIQPDCSRHSCKYRSICRHFFQQSPRRILHEDCALLHEQQRRAVRDDLFEAMFRKQNRHGEVPVQTVQRRQKVCCRDRVKLRSRLIQKQKLRLHDHDAREIQKLLLSAGKRRGIAVKQLLNAKIRCDLRDAPPHDIGRRIEIFESEGQLMPDAVGHDLLLGVLHHKADLCCGCPVIERGKRLAVKGNAPGLRTERRQLRLAHPQKRGFAAAGRAAEHGKIPGVQRKGNVG